MPNQDDYRKVAETLRDQLGRKTFLTLERRDITDILRRISGEQGTRIKILGAQKIMDELEGVGLTLYPDLYSVSSYQNVRVLRKDSFLVELVDLLNNPNTQTDTRLRQALRNAEDKLDASVSL